MTRPCCVIARPVLVGAIMILTAGALTATAGEHRWRRGRQPVAPQPVPTAYRDDPVYGGRLGTFMPTPAIVVQANYPIGGGFAPLGTFGETAMSLYGPFSALRPATAPVLTYTRGYDGVVRPAEAISSSYPNLPRLSPVAYPTRANYYYAPRILEYPGQTSAINWLDQN